VTAESKFAVGDTVYMSNWRIGNRGRGPTELVVTKVARKYVTAVDPDRRFLLERQFDKVTGQAPRESGDYIETAADRAAQEARAAATERLKALGFRGIHDFPRDLSAEALNRIADVVEADLGSSRS
jgi:hypothetical protein